MRFDTSTQHSPLQDPESLAMQTLQSNKSKSLKQPVDAAENTDWTGDRPMQYLLHRESVSLPHIQQVYYTS